MSLPISAFNWCLPTLLSGAPLTSTVSECTPIHELYLAQINSTKLSLSKVFLSTFSTSQVKENRIIKTDNVSKFNQCFNERES